MQLGVRTYDATRLRSFRDILKITTFILIDHERGATFYGSE